MTINRSRASLLIAMICAGACGTLQNTPAQDRVEADFKACRDETHDDVMLERVSPDGRFSYRLATNQIESKRFQACMEKRGYRFQR